MSDTAIQCPTGMECDEFIAIFSKEEGKVAFDSDTQVLRRDNPALLAKIQREFKTSGIVPVAHDSYMMPLIWHVSFKKFGAGAVALV